MLWQPGEGAETGREPLWQHGSDSWTLALAYNCHLTSVYMEVAVRHIHKHTERSDIDKPKAGKTSFQFQALKNIDDLILILIEFSS